MVSRPKPKPTPTTCRVEAEGKRESSFSKKTMKSDVNKGRYAAKVTKGDSAWKQEWSGFISNVKMDRKEGCKAMLKDCMDWETAAGTNFAYLFGSPSVKKAERDVKKKKKRNPEEKTDEQKRISSKMQSAMEHARLNGLHFEGMNRKQKRMALRLRITEEERQAREHSRKIKPHELMDPKLEWYQQGPSPLDLVAEKLVNRKAQKRTNQLGLRYNYLRVHPSWEASRARNRKWSMLIHTGTHTQLC